MLPKWSVKGALDLGGETGNDVIWSADPELYDAVRSSEGPEEARHSVRDLMLRREIEYQGWDCQVEALERANALNCIKVVRNFLAPRNERLSGISVISHLHGLASDLGTIGHPGFLFDIANLLRGTMCMSGINGNQPSDVTYPEGGEGAILRSEHLDSMARSVGRWVGRYPTGLDPAVIGIRRKNRERILSFFNASLDDWNDYTWQMRNVLLDAGVIGDLIDLTAEEFKAIEMCTSKNVPFGITPYYLSLMDHDTSRQFDHAVRAQVIPPLDYVLTVSDRRGQSSELDFMMEGQTSPVDLVTRRYPMIAIFKPYNTCAQICVYCQRNWEIEGVMSPNAMASQERIDAAIKWFQEHPAVSEVLVTGGDPAIMSNNMLRKALSRLGELDHIKAIRLGTRVPVVLPMRVDEGFLSLISDLHDPPRRSFSLVTHFEHVYEVTPEAAGSIRSLRRLGISIYNQQVFTMENCRRFETVALRLMLKSIGIDPYYTFNAKGKEETSAYRVPISRLLQERKEEARLIPGSARTDEPVFNIPALGKNHLRAWQHHDLISLTPRGERIYEFHPWEKNISPAPTYIHRDVPIYDFLLGMASRGEDTSEYDSIWYYL